MADSTAFPWLKHLPEDEQRAFFMELHQKIGDAVMDTMPGVETPSGTYVEHLDPLLAAWCSTAEVHADPELYAALTRPGGFDEGDFEEVSRPEADDREPLPVRIPPPAKRCAASLPHEDADDGWYRCIQSKGHPGLHHEGDPEIGWRDGEIVEVCTTSEVRAVPDHKHDFVGDEDTCVGHSGCQLSWGEMRGASADLVIVDEIQGFVPPQREASDG